MNDLIITKTLERGQSAVVTAQQMAALLGKDACSTAVMLTRLVKRGVLVRVLRGRYSLPSTDALAVASGIHHPSYVSLLAAFEHYGTTTQSPRMIDVVNAARSGQLELALEAGRFVVRFIRVKPSLLYGYAKVYLNGAAALIAEKERAIVDGLLLPGYVPLDEIASCMRSGIDVRKAMEYAVRTKRQAVMKRMGYMLTLMGLECSPEDFGKLSRTFVPLDPALPRRGKYNEKWHVMVNRVIE